MIFRYKASDATGKYTYIIGICSPALDDGSDTGILQTEIGGNDTHIVGLISDADFIQGSMCPYLSFNSNCYQEFKRSSL